MSVTALIEELHSLHVDLSLDGDKLRVNAPQGVLNPELKARIADLASTCTVETDDAVEGATEGEAQ